MRPGADQAHLTLEHVPELRELVETNPAQDAPEWRHPRVIRQRRAVTTVIAAFIPHGTKLVTVELLVILPNTPLHEQHRSWGIQLYSNSYEAKQRNDQRRHNNEDRKV